MFRWAHQEWILSVIWTDGIATTARRSAARRLPIHRRLRIEPLEDRRMLATITVNTLIDVNDPNDGLTTLREAIAQAAPGDTIDFSVTGAINLSNLGQLVIDKSLTILGPGPDLLTVRAYDPTPDVHNLDGSRVFNIGVGAPSDTEVRISRMTITGGDRVGSGGGIFSNVRTYLDELIVHDNHAADGAGITIEAGGYFELSNSTLHSNEARGRGGGIEVAFASGVIRNTAIIHNHSRSIGGGLSVLGSQLWIEQTTFSGNTSNDYGGGMMNRSSALNIRHSTIANNHSNVDGVGSGNGGIDSNLSKTTSVTHSIVANNTNAGAPSDISNNVALSYSLVGYSSGLTEAPVGSPDANGSLIGGPVHGIIDPLLDPLANNGGPTMTHALLPGSPAIDAGDPSAAAGADGVPEFDQRGASFTRVHGGRIDIGAFEAQPPPGLQGDHNQDGWVNAADYVLWRKTGIHGQQGYIDWRTNFGNTLSQAAASDEQAVASDEQEASISFSRDPEGSADGELVRGQETRAQQEAHAQPQEFRIAEFGLRIGGSREPKGEGRASQRVTAVERWLRDDALVAWLALRDDGRGRADELRGPLYNPSTDAATDDTFETLDLAFDALAGDLV